MIKAMWLSFTQSAKTKFFWALFIAIPLLATVLRLYQLGRVPVGLYWDEAAMLVDVKSVIQTGRDMFGNPWYQTIYASYGDFKLPVYIWLASAAAKFFGLSEWSFRLPSVLAGLGTIIIGGYLAKELSKSRLLQLFTMLVLSVSPWAIMFSRTGFEANVGQFFLALSVLCLLVSRRRGQFWWVFLAAVFGAAATYSYFSVRFVWPVVFLVVQLLFTKNLRQKLLQNVFLRIVLPCILFGLLLIPMWRSPFYGDMNRFRLGTDSVLNSIDYPVESNIYREQAGNSRFDRILFSSQWLMARELLKNYSENVSLNFLFIFGDPNYRHGTQRAGLFFLFFLPFFLFGWYELYVKNKKIFWLLLIWWLVALLPASVPSDVPHALRSLNALVPLAIVISYGMYSFWTAVNAAKKEKNIRILTATLFFICFVVSIGSFLVQYFLFYPRESASDWQDGYKQLALAIEKEKQPNEKVWIVSFDDRFYLWLMAYGPYTGKDFQSWQSEGYHFTNFDNISFRGIDHEKINTEKNILVAGQPKRMQEELAKVTRKQSNIEEIKGADGTVRFWLAKFM